METAASIVHKAIKNEVAEPQLAEVVGHFFQVAGGARKVAEMLYTEYNAAKQGSLIRQRILESVLRTTKYVNDKTGPVEDTGLMSEEDLERAAAALLKFPDKKDA